MENKHVYIFYGDPRTGKSDLARVIGNCNPAAAYIIDDLTCGKNVINTNPKVIGSYDSSWKFCMERNTANTTCVWCIPNSSPLAL